MSGFPKWLFFDCFNTLVDEGAVIGEELYLSSILEYPVEWGFFQSAGEFRAAYGRWSRRQWTGSEKRELELSVRLRQVLLEKDPSRRSQVHALVDQMVSRVMTEYPNALVPTPGVETMLRAWQSRTRMAVVSNFFMAGWPARILDRFNLAQYFEFILDSATFGWKKPDERIYVEALRLAGIPRDRASDGLFVGDNLLQDYETPKRLGMRAIYFNRSLDGRPSEEPERGWSITSWEEFLPTRFEKTPTA